MPFDYEATVRQLQDTLTVMAGIQERQARVQKLQADEVDAVRQRLAEHESRMQRVEANLETATTKLAEVTGKLDALIDIVDGWMRKKG